VAKGTGRAVFNLTTVNDGCQDEAVVTQLADVAYGSWLCENAKTLNRDRRTCSSKTDLVAQRASGFNLEIELKNIILRRVSIFEFLHSQGQSRKLARLNGMSVLPSILL
jgi:hypothetical protein